MLVCGNSYSFFLYMPVHLLQLKSLPILEQLRIEEALLRADDRNWCIVNHGSSDAIVMGISGKMEELINQKKMEESPVQLIRRFSGGGTVFVDENTCFVTFICNSSFVSIPPFPQSIMQWTEQFYKPLFQEFTLKENDYILGNKKFGGNAQSICKNRWLHHSSLLWDYCPQKMEYLLLPKKSPAYRQQRSHNDFLCRLNEFWHNPRAFLDSFLDQVCKNFELREVSLKEIEGILLKDYRRATIVEKYCQEGLVKARDQHVL